jgi:hypothetical protein
LGVRDAVFAQWARFHQAIAAHHLAVPLRRHSRACSAENRVAPRSPAWPSRLGATAPETASARHAPMIGSFTVMPWTYSIVASIAIMMIAGFEYLAGICVGFAK